MVLLGGTPAFAAPEAAFDADGAGVSAAASAKEQIVASPAKERTTEQRLISGNIAIAEWFDGVADGLDMYLIGRRITREKNTSFVKFTGSVYSTEGNNLTTGLGTNAVLRLPNVEKYWQLKFETTDSSERERGTPDRAIRPNQQRNYGATVGLFRKLGNVKTIFQPRIELQDPLKISHSLIFESIAEQKDYSVNPRLEFFAHATKGPGIFQALNFHRTLDKIRSLTLINDGEYLEKQHKLSVTNGVSFGYLVADRMTLGTGIMFGSNNRPSYHLENYVVSVAWNQLLYKNILDYGITPFIDFQLPRGFRGLGGVTIDVNLNF